MKKDDSGLVSPSDTLDTLSKSTESLLVVSTTTTTTTTVVVESKHTQGPDTDEGVVISRHSQDLDFSLDTFSDTSGVTCDESVSKSYIDESGSSDTNILGPTAVWYTPTNPVTDTLTNSDSSLYNITSLTDETGITDDNLASSPDCWSSDISPHITNTLPSTSPSSKSTFLDNFKRRKSVDRRKITTTTMRDVTDSPNLEYNNKMLTQDGNISPNTDINRHNLKPIKTNKCSVCSVCKKNMMKMNTRAVQCTSCQRVFHKDCTSSSSNVVCQPTTPLTGRSLRIRTRAWRGHYPDDQIINDKHDLRRLDEFLLKKVSVMEGEGQGKNDMASFFIRCVKELRQNIISTYSVSLQDDDELRIKLTYKDVMLSFEAILEKANEEDSTTEFALPTGLQSMSGFLNDFKNLPVDRRPWRPWRKKKKKFKTEEIQGHHFLVQQFIINTFCEVCTQEFGILEKGHVCEVCTLACHKRCSHESNICTGSVMSVKKVFGIPLLYLVSRTDSNIPITLEKILTHIELTGLYTPLIYRKNSSVIKRRQLVEILDNNDVSSVVLNQYSPHTLAGVVKHFLQQLPDPLLTFELYSDFIWSQDFSDDNERVISLYTLVDRLPKPNYDVLQRLIYHLARVAQNVLTNFMSANSLAIIFAPTLLKARDKSPVETMGDTTRQRQCLEILIERQLSKLTSALETINTVDTESLSTQQELQLLSGLSTVDRQCSHTSEEDVCSEYDDKLTTEQQTDTIRVQKLSRQLTSLNKERHSLLTNMSLLVTPRRVSDDEIEASMDEDGLESALTSSEEAVIDSPVQNFRRWNSNRRSWFSRKRRPKQPGSDSEL